MAPGGCPPNQARRYLQIPEQIHRPIPPSPIALFGVAAKERGTAFGPRRDDFRFVVDLFDDDEEHTRKSRQT